MIIKSYEANKSNLEGRSIILLYGKNEGLQNETVEKTFISGFKGSIDKYDENEFINTYEIIFTHDQRLLSLGEKYKWVPAQGFWIKDPKIYQKSK